MLKHKKEVTTENKANNVDWNAEHDLNLLAYEKREGSMQTLTGFAPYTIASRTISVPADATEPEIYLVMGKATAVSNSSSGEWGVSSLFKVDGEDIDGCLMVASGPDQGMTTNNLHILTVNPGESKTIQFVIVSTVDASLYPASAMFVMMQIGNKASAPVQA